MTPLSVVVPTRNRGAAIISCVRSLLLEPDPGLELIVIDQSDDDATGRALAEAIGDRRLRYSRSSGRGVAAGRNEGMRLSLAPVVFMTDDDCEAHPGFVPRIQAAFADRRIGLAFGSVRPAPHDVRKGFIPSCAVEEVFVGTRVADKARLDGMGACMALRRDLWEQLHGFDESLGAGTAFRSGEETDFCLRALRAGQSVLLTPDVEVIHHGFRPAQDARSLADGYWYGTGAVFGKLIRSRPLDAGILLGRLGWRFMFGSSPVARSLDGAATRRARLVAFGRGLWDGSRRAVDSATDLFRMP